jgi:hypothetical protein
MRRVLICAVMIAGIVSQLPAQVDFPGSVLLVPLGGAAPARGTDPSVWVPDSPGGHPADTGFPSWGYASDPFYGGNHGNNSSAQPSIVVLIPQVVAPSQPAPVAAPPQPVRSETAEYHWPSSGGDSSADTFAIVSKDGRVQSSTAVWMQDDALCYIASDGSGRIPIDLIDREATRQRNTATQLNLLLPLQIRPKESNTSQVVLPPTPEGQ